jgi:4'-phosphopantetheinyl transferase
MDQKKGSRTRSEAFYRKQHGDRFVVSRGALRVLLGLYLNAKPATIEFAYGYQGKPHVTFPSVALPISFNLSHSEELALIALTPTYRVGVDVEKIRPLPDLDRLVRWFSAVERREYQRLPSALRIEGFFNGWTRKEAFLKACGDGLALPLDTFDVSLAPGRPARLKRIRGTPATNWFIHAFEPHPGYIAALAVERHTLGVAIYDFNERLLNDT